MTGTLPVNGATIRLPWVDIAKGIGICLVVLGHTRLPPLVMTFIYSFHVPLFFVLSGFVISKDLVDTWSRFIAKRLRTLVWPYVVFSILGASVLGLSSNKSYYIFVSGAIADAMKFQDSIDTPLWFLLALFSASVCFRMLSALPKAVVGCVSLVLFFLSIYVSGFLGFDLPFRLISSLQYVVFLYCGYCAALYCGIDFLTRFGPGLKRSANLALYVVGIIFICAIVDGMGVMITSIGFLATSILGSLMVVELSLMIFRWRFFSSILGWCGRNSLGILCVHELVMISVRKFLTPILGRGIDQISMVLFIFLLVLLFAKRFPFLYKMPLGIPYFHKHDRTSM